MLTSPNDMKIRYDTDSYDPYHSVFFGRCFTVRIRYESSLDRYYKVVIDHKRLPSPPAHLNHNYKRNSYSISYPLFT